MFPHSLGFSAPMQRGCGGSGEKGVRRRVLPLTGTAFLSCGCSRQRCGAGAMSLRDDIEALTAALHRFSRLQNRGNGSGTPDSIACSSEDNCSGDTGREKSAGRHTSCAGVTTQASEFDISAISMAAEGDDAEAAPAQQAAAVNFLNPKVSEDTFGAPPSSNTTALPCGDGPDAYRRGGSGFKVARVTAPGEKAALDDSPTAVWETNRSRRASSSVMAAEATRLSTLALDATATSSGNSTALQDTPQHSQRQMEEAYRHILRKLLLEIHRLDARSKALSEQCEGERENRRRLQRKHEQELLDRNALIGALRQQLVAMCAGGDSASSGGARVSSGSDWTLGHHGVRFTPPVANRWSAKESRGESGAGTTTELHPYDRPVASSELCGVSSSSTAERSSRQGPQRASEEVEREGSSVSLMRQGVSSDAVTSTRPHSLRGFQQKRSTCWGATRAFEEVATQTSNAGMPETAATAVMDTERVKDALEEVPRKGSTSALGEVGRGNGGEADTPVRRATSKPAVHHPYGERRKRRSHASTEVEECEREKNRRKRRVPATQVVPRIPAPFGCPGERLCQRPSGSGLCCRTKLGAEARAGPQRDLKGTRAASRPCCTASARTRRNQGRTEQSETCELLYGIMAKHTMVEARLRIFQEVLKKQEMGLREMNCLLRDVMLPLAMGPQKSRPTADSP
ncbi:uncharacterized protein Tco025E_02209 [Trypanosoma conorhini]|uniref:Uncharacterized protein n=1 Tax=Trypanosoma conorhini TaxID=83891 RepID=A0A3R7M330_9TRYP|nr:uncharacterized protein Tco025E_02209 [Trypanosoma conorhini]RNF25649.1 hypothetical protein Tco025E_02209 [Trypanosoma conorhini]